MPTIDTRAGYTGVAKLLHWLILALLVVQFAVAWTMPNIGRGSVPTGLIGWHLSVGLTILAVMLVRFAWRLTHSVPPAPSDLPRSLALLSRITHYLLYAVLIVLPLLGWANASARGWAVRLFGVVPLPPLTMKGSALGHQLGNVHATLATVLLAIVALSAAESSDRSRHWTPLNGFWSSRASAGGCRSEHGRGYLICSEIEWRQRSLRLCRKSDNRHYVK